jgi:activating signal cointegrator 1
MKALSLIQPYATLILLGYKLYETRSWDTKHRGPLAIHASAGKPAWARQQALSDPVICEVLERHGLTFDTLPRGVVLGSAEVVSTHPTLSLSDLSIEELAVGDYTPGRFAWRLANTIVLPEPIPCKGALSLWELPGWILRYTPLRLPC